MFDHPFSTGEECYARYESCQKELYHVSDIAEEYRLKNKRLEAENAELKKQLAEKDKVMEALASQAPVGFCPLNEYVNREDVVIQRIAAAEKAVKESEEGNDKKI